MTDDMLKNVLELAHATADKDGWFGFPEGRLMTLYAGHAGVSLTISKVASLRLTAGLVRARNSRGDEYTLATADLFATSLDVGKSSDAPRKAGFLG